MTRNEFFKRYGKKRYVGEEVFIHFDGEDFILTVERKDGRHWISLGPNVFEAIIDYRSYVNRRFKKVED